MTVGGLARLMGPPGVGLPASLAPRRASFHCPSSCDVHHSPRVWPRGHCQWLVCMPKVLHHRGPARADARHDHLGRPRTAATSSALKNVLKAQSAP